MSETVMERIIRAKESRKVEQLAEAIQVLVEEAELQHKALIASIQTSQKALSKKMISVAVGIGLLVGIASGIGSWILIKEHYIKTELADALFLNSELKIKKKPILIEEKGHLPDRLILPLEKAQDANAKLLIEKSDGNQILIPKGTIIEADGDSSGINKLP